MNIFFLDNDPALAAVYHGDKHVVKMVLETAQLLSTTCRIRGLYREPMYKATHQNHPCAVWVRESLENYSWTYDLFTSLLEEYEHRYDKVHSCYRLIDVLRPDAGGDIAWPHVGLSTPAQAMPDQYRGPDPVAAYRRYYLGEKRHLAVYTGRPAPKWMESAQ